MGMLTLEFSTCKCGIVQLTSTPLPKLYLVAYFVSYSPKAISTLHVKGALSSNHDASALPAVKHALALLPEGANLHCIAVSACCFKTGRITIPPRVALISSGFGDPSADRWTRLQELRREHKLLPLLRGGYKEEEELAHGKLRDFWRLGEYEKRRVQGMHWLDKLKLGLDMYGTNLDAE
jgi:hypothetical protein